MFNAEILDLLLQVIFVIVGAVVARERIQFARKTGLDIEQRHIDRIKDAIRNVAAAAYADGKTDVNEITSLAVKYLINQMPMAMAKVNPSQDAIKTIAKAQIETLFNRSAN